MGPLKSDWDHINRGVRGNLKGYGRISLFGPTNHHFIQAWTTRNRDWGHGRKSSDFVDEVVDKDRDVHIPLLGSEQVRSVHRELAVYRSAGVVRADETNERHDSMP